MVKVSAPAMSLDASGSLAGTLVFSKWKGRNYVRQLVRPSNPKTPGQLGIRAMLKFLSHAWKTIGDVAQASWVTTAAAANVSPFNSYVSANMSNWREYIAPSQASPPARTHTAATLSANDATGGVRHATLVATLSTTTNQWGMLIFRDTAEITTLSWNNVVAVTAAPSTTAFSYTDAPLDPGTYHYRMASITDDGVIGTATADDSAVVT